MKHVRKNETLTRFAEVGFAVGTAGFGPVVRDYGVPVVKTGAQKAKDGIKSAIEQAKVKHQAKKEQKKNKEIDEALKSSHEKLAEVISEMEES